MKDNNNKKTTEEQKNEWKRLEMIIQNKYETQQQQYYQQLQEQIRQQQIQQQIGNRIIGNGGGRIEKEQQQNTITTTLNEYDNFKSTKRKAVPFTDEEVFQLFTGYAKYGSDFDLILEKYDFLECRRRESLADKFRKTACLYPDWRAAYIKAISKNKKVMPPPPGGKKRKKPLYFTKREVKSIFKGVKEHGERWRLIRSSYAFLEDRTAFSIRKKYHSMKHSPPETLDTESDDDEPAMPPKMANEPRQMHKFTQDEITWIVEGLKRFGKNWNAILAAYPFAEGRTAKSLEHKYYRSIRTRKINHTRTTQRRNTRRRFTKKEMEWIQQGVNLFGTDWIRIMNHFPFVNRSVESLQNKYHRLKRRRSSKALMTDEEMKEQDDDDEDDDEDEDDDMIMEDQRPIKKKRSCLI
mmetsp:Transcript_11630/g.17216  ORF Transcript_11630/g.17216 Transcript_11630/m.17216 type:complete len:409 (-) Transcript_11630:40-1266(-)